MTYDDVADIKAALQAMLLLLERMNDTLERIHDDTILIQDNGADIAFALQPMIERRYSHAAAVTPEDE